MLFDSDAFALPRDSSDLPDEIAGGRAASARPSAGQKAGPL